MIASHLFLAMEEIVYQFIGTQDPEKAIAFLLHFAASDNNQYSYQNCWVAEEDGEVMAALVLYIGSHLSALRQPVIDYLETEFSRCIKPEDETREGEYYIDSLGVQPDKQGKGIGTKLLQFVIDEYVNKQHQTLGLLVDEQNAKAKRLYLKLGFKMVDRKVLFGKQMEHLQIG